MTWATRSPVAYVGAGLFVVGAGMGLVFMIQGNSAKSNAESLTAKVKDNVAKSTDLSPAERAAPCAAPVNARYVTPCADLRSNLDAQDSDRTLSTVGFIGAVVGAGVVVGGYFLTAKKGGGEAASAPAPRFMLAPVIGPQMNGLGAVGSF